MVIGGKRGFSGLTLLVLIFIVFMIIMSIGVLVLSTLNDTLSGNTTDAANQTNESIQILGGLANGSFESIGMLIAGIVFIAIIMFAFATIRGR